MSWITPSLATVLWLAGAAAGFQAQPSGIDCRDPAHNRGPEGLEAVCALVEDGRFASAERRARELLARVERTHGPDSVETARVLDQLSEAIRRGGGARRPETLEVAERAAAIKRAALGAEHPELATSLHNVATFLFINDRLGEARAIFERALAIRERGLGADHPLVANSLTYLGSLLADLGEDEAALAALRRGLGIRERALGREHRDVAWSLNSLANLLDKRGDYAEARAHYERALRIREAALRPDHPYVAISLHNLARLLTTIGDYAGARSLYERALAIREESGAALASTLNLLGELLTSTGDYAEARELLERSRDLRIGERGPDHPSVAWDLDMLARLSMVEGKLDQARPLLDRGLRIREDALGPDHRYVADSLHELARWSLRAGDHAAAARLLERTVKIEERHLGADHPDVASSLVTRADVLRAAGKPEAALPLYARARRIQEQSIGKEHPNVARTVLRQAYLLRQTGQAREALEAALHAEQTSRDHLLLTGRFLAERQVLDYAASRTKGMDLALQLALEAREPPARRRTWDALIRSRALVFDELAARHHALERTQNPEIASLVERLRRASTRLSNLQVRGVAGDSPENYRSRLRGARSDQERAQRVLAEKSAVFRQDRISSRVGLDEVVTSLPAGAALVSFFVYDADAGFPGAPAARRYLAVVHRGTAGPVFVPIGSATEIDHHVRQWREESARGLLSRRRTPAEAVAASRQTGVALRRRIWDPLAPHLKGAERVFVVPDGSLQLVNVAALPVGESGYLIESGPLIHYLSAERDLVVRSGRAGRGMLALGDPDFEGALERIASAPTRDGCTDFSSRRFTSLPTTALEVQRIAVLWRTRRGSEAVVLEGRSASETAFKSRAPGKRVLHLATHGFFLDGACSSAPRGARGIGGLSSLEADAPPATSPLRLSGLALAGANRRSEARIDTEDGILTADEIAALDLSGVEWAVLSACETGVGEISAGEGVFGLRRAFQTAGAGTVIMSLWSVDDPTTLRWMTALYEARLRDGLETTEAIRRASLRILEEGRATEAGSHPFYWSSFIAVGDWR